MRSGSEPTNPDEEDPFRDDEQLQAEIRALQAAPPPPAVDDEAKREKKERAARRSGLIGGAVALFISLVGLRYVAPLPAGLLLLDGALVWGYLSFAKTLGLWRGREPDGAWMTAVAASLAIPTALRFLAVQQAWSLPVAFYRTLALPVVLLSLATVVLLAPRTQTPATWASRAGFIAWTSLGLAALTVAGFGLLGEPRPGAWSTLGLTILVAGVLLVFQFTAHRILRRPSLAVFAGAPALLLAATQLLDGTVSYLAVKNPLGLLPFGLTEQMAISAFLIEWTGPGYILVKWILALVLARVLSGFGGRLDDPYQRLLLFLVVVYIGVGPALFSTLNLLG
ncbi:MAG: DUF63 family protein [Candidatus Thermoplasmatota archaeon]